MTDKVKLTREQIEEIRDIGAELLTAPSCMNYALSPFAGLKHNESRSIYLPSTHFTLQWPSENQND